MRRRRTVFARGLAAAFLGGPWNRKDLESRAIDALGRRMRGMRALIRKVIERFPQPPAGRPEPLVAFIAETASFPGARIHRWRRIRPTMAEPLPDLASLALPATRSVGELAHWLGVERGHLAWFADVDRRLHRGAAARLRHYRYRWIPKRSGAYRLLEAPKSRLKTIQRRILREVLDAVPPHDAAHGFRRGRSVLSHATPHVGRDVVLRIDLADFFAAVTEARVRAIFRSLGYPDGVTRTLAALCCTPTPVEVLAAQPPSLDSEQARRHYEQRQRLSCSHLPQGAPTSPALANLAAFRLDRRLSSLAARWGAHYTRYADDLAFSGDRRLATCATTFIGTVGAIAAEEGFDIRFRKTRLMGRAVRQQLAGIVVNVRPGLPRPEIERLEAMLYNCVRHGPASQNRAKRPDFRDHLAGRVAWAEATGPTGRTRRLREMFERISW